MVVSFAYTLCIHCICWQTAQALPFLPVFYCSLCTFYRFVSLFPALVECHTKCSSCHSPILSFSIPFHTGCLHTEFLLFYIFQFVFRSFHIFFLPIFFVVLFEFPFMLYSFMLRERVRVIFMCMFQTE